MLKHHSDVESLPVLGQRGPLSEHSLNSFADQLVSTGRGAVITKMMMADSRSGQVDSVVGGPCLEHIPEIIGNYVRRA